jgi:hypothetical protein
LQEAQQALRGPFSSPVPRGRCHEVTEGVFASAFALLEANTPIPPSGYFPRWAGEENGPRAPHCKNLSHTRAPAPCLSP